MTELVGDVAVVTGGSTGIGRGVAESLARRGARVVITGRRAEVLEEAARGIGAEVGEDRVLAVPGDATSAADVAATFDAAEKAFGRVDVLVNNAGGGPLRPIAVLDEETWAQVFTGNTTSAFLAMREYIRRRPEGGAPGSIVNISSVNGGLGGVTPGHAAYSAAKAALDQLTRVAAAEFGPSGVRVNSVAPGATRSETFSDAVVDGPLGRAFAERTPLGRVAEASDIAEVVTFLCSRAAAWVTGVVLQADGGTHLLGVPDFLDVMARWQRDRPAQQ